MLHTKYQGFSPCDPSRRFYIAYVKHVTPVAGPIWPLHNLNKHDSGLLGDATYLISRL